MAPWVRAIAAMSDGLSLVLRTHKVGGGELIPTSCPQAFTLVPLQATSKTEAHSCPKTFVSLSFWYSVFSKYLPCHAPTSFKSSTFPSLWDPSWLPLLKC